MTNYYSDLNRRLTLQVLEQQKEIKKLAAMNRQLMTLLARTLPFLRVLATEPDYLPRARGIEVSIAIPLEMLRESKAFSQEVDQFLTEDDAALEEDE